jgi:transcription elongation factor GreA
MTDTTYLTQEGLAKLQAELKDLKKHQRPDMIGRLEAAKQLGDLSENAEYHEAKDTLAFIEGRIREVELLLRDVSMIADEKKTAGKVSIGSTINVEVRGTTKTYQIVGSSEAEPANGRISNESPLGSSFIGHKAGETVVVETPGGKVEYEIVDVR